MTFSVLPVPGLGSVAGDDLAQPNKDVLPPLEEGDILAVTSKIIEQAEGRQIAAADREERDRSGVVRVVATRSTPSASRASWRTARVSCSRRGERRRATPRKARSCCCPRTGCLGAGAVQRAARAVQREPRRPHHRYPRPSVAGARPTSRSARRASEVLDDLRGTADTTGRRAST